MNGVERTLRPKQAMRLVVFAVGLLVVATMSALGCGKTDNSAQSSNPVSCLAPTLACNGRCVDISSDPPNCGACGAACPAGVACTGGMCDGQSCPAGRASCGGMCVDLQTNPLNCGKCNTACSGAQACVEGACVCPAPARNCGGECFHTDTSQLHCGGCGRECAASEVCVAGSCQLRCAPPAILCGDRCVETTSDPSACGNCQTSCSGAEVCNAGRCECPNDGVHMQCEGACVDIRVQADHCGGCGNRCPAGQRCSNGQCTACPTDFFFCPSGGGDPRETCLAQARAVRADAGTAPSPDLECQCNSCLVELQDCVNDGTCVGTWQCALRNSCTTPCWGTMGVCSLGGGTGCFKWCPPSGTPQTAARVEALMRCTREKCGG